MIRKKGIIRWGVITAAFITLLLILWNTYSFFQNYKEEERIKMKIWAEASNALNDADLNDADMELPLLILTNNSTIPIVQTNDKDSILSMVNIDEKIINNPRKAQLFLKRLKSQNAPIEVSVGKYKQYLYYGNSSLLVKLKYYPITLILVFVFFIVLIFNFYRSNKIATQNRLWTGMAKETAHQIGTPLSSLLGWIEIMKLDQVSPAITDEIEKDVKRLEIIANRFSKIGSKPQLSSTDIISETYKVFEYLQRRTSKQINFEFKAPTYPIFVLLNSELHSWTIENLIKNAIDAMKGKGDINVLIQDGEQHVHLYVSDTGKGIPRKMFNKIFEPGYTTKKRGWGLGLSLTKRIVEDFQNGKIKVLHSETGKGTTFYMVYKKEKAIV